MRSILKASVLAATLGGCVASAGVGYHANVVVPAAPVVYVPPAPTATVVVDAQPAPAPMVVEEQPAEVEVAYQEPQAYVYVNPNVQVIENYDYPVFFSNNLYWRNEGGVWYSSSYHDRGWITGGETPVYIRSINRPETFVHYHADVHARVGQPGYRYVPPAPIHHSAPPPRYIDHPGHPVQPVGHGPIEHGPVHPTEPARPMQPEHTVQPTHPMQPEHNAPPARPMQPEHQIEPSHPTPTNAQTPTATHQPVTPVHAPLPPPTKATPAKAPPPPAAPPPKKKK